MKKACSALVLMRALASAALVLGAIGAQMAFAQAPEPVAEQGADLPQRGSDRKSAVASEIHLQRLAIERDLASRKALCYKQFAVNGCLKQARAEARSAQAQLDTREQEDKERVRKTQSAQHHLAVQSHRPRVEESNSRTPVPHSRKPTTMPQKVHSPGRQGQATAAIKQRREQAQGRRDAQALDARKRLQEKQTAAAAHASALERRERQRAEKGRKPAAPLPEPAP